VVDTPDRYMVPIGCLLDLEEGVMSETTTYRVEGMTCDHCVRAVKSELDGLPGVKDVDVDLESGQVTVASDEPLDTAAVRAAVEEAGYEVAS
jgi:copper chaperone